MGTGKHTIIFWALLALSPVHTSSAQWTERADRIGPASAESISNTRYATCIVKVTVDADVLPLDFKAVEALLRSDGIAGKAASDVLGVRIEPGSDFFDAEELASVLEPAVKSKSGVEAWRSGFGGASSFGAADSTGYGQYKNAVYPGGYVNYRLYQPKRPVMFGTQPGAESTEPAVEQTVVFGLAVHLPLEVKPLARDFARALVGNLRSALQEAFAAHVKRLSRQIEQAESVQAAARAELDEAVRLGMPRETDTVQLDPADEAVYKQLKEIVDLSRLEPDTRFKEAIKILANSVEPPLKIVVFWRDLYDNADIVPTRPIDLSGPGQATLEKGLESVLKAVSKGLTELDYVVEGGVVTVATTDSLPLKLETRVYKVPAIIQATGNCEWLIDALMETVEPESWYELSDTGEGTVACYQGAKLVVFQTRKVHKAILEFLKKLAEDIPVTMPVDTSEEILSEHVRRLLPYRDELEKQVDQLQEDQAALAEKNRRFEEEAREKIWGEVNAELQSVVGELEAIKAKIKGSRPYASELTHLKQVIDNLKSNIKKKSERPDGQIEANPHGSPWSDEESGPTSRLYAKRWQLSAVRGRIEKIEALLVEPRVFDAEVARIHLTVRTLELASARVHELKDRVAKLHEPSVTVVGALD